MFRDLTPKSGPIELPLYGTGLLAARVNATGVRLLLMPTDLAKTVSCGMAEPCQSPPARPPTRAGTAPTDGDSSAQHIERNRRTGLRALRDTRRGLRHRGD